MRVKVEEPFAFPPPLTLTKMLSRTQAASPGKSGRTARTIPSLDLHDLVNKDIRTRQVNRPGQHRGDPSTVRHAMPITHEEAEEEESEDAMEDLTSEAYTITMASKQFLSMSVAETRVVPDRRQSELCTPNSSRWSDGSPSGFPRTPGLLLAGSDDEDDLEEEDITMAHPSTYSPKLLHRQSLMKRHWKMKQIFGDVPPPIMTKTGVTGRWDDYNNGPREPESSFLDFSRDDVSEILSLYNNQSEAGDEEEEQLDISQRRIVKLSKFFGVDHLSGLQNHEYAEDACYKVYFT